MTIRRNQELSYFTEIASLAPTSIQVVRFTPLDIDPLTELVNGLSYNHSERKWEGKSFPLPDYIYDRCFYNDPFLSKKAEPIVNWLKQRPGTTFLGYGLPNKLEVYESLKTEEAIAPYLPNTSIMSTYPKLIRLLKKEKSIILKPIKGSGGNGIVHIQLLKNGVTIHSQHKGEKIYKTFTTQSDFRTYIEQLLSETDFVSQTYLHLQKSNRPFDVRILLQKNKDGKWKEQGRGVRVGTEYGLVSNLQNGGNVISFEKLQNDWSSIEKQLILEEIDTIITHVPRLLEEKFGRLFELGVDIGISNIGAVWLLDLNSKPGRKVITTTTSSENKDLYKSIFEYMNYLEANKSSIGKE